MHSENNKKKTFKKYPVGYFHINIAQVHTGEGRLYLFVAIDRTSKFAYAQLHGCQEKMIAADFLRNLIAIVPYKITHILTDNSIQFANRKKDKYAFAHIFDCVYFEYNIEHRLTKIKIHGQMNQKNLMWIHYPTTWE